MFVLSCSFVFSPWCKSNIAENRWHEFRVSQGPGGFQSTKLMIAMIEGMKVLARGGCMGFKLVRLPKVLYRSFGLLQLVQQTTGERLILQTLNFVCWYTLPLSFGKSYRSASHWVNAILDFLLSGDQRCCFMVGLAWQAPLVKQDVHTPSSLTRLTAKVKKQQLLHFRRSFL